MTVIPTYNERENIEQIVGRVVATGCDVLVVDDDSPDGTGALAKALSAQNPRVEVLQRTGPRGLGPAYADGFAQVLASGAEIICQMDADFSHDPEDLPRLIAGIERGAGLVIGSRYVPGGSTPDWAMGRRWLSGAGNLYARVMLRSRIRDLTGGFRAWSAATLAAVEPATCESSGYAFQVEMAWRAERAGLGVVEEPIIFRDRRVGDSKMDRSIVVEAMRLVTEWGIRRRAARLP